MGQAKNWAEIWFGSDESKREKRAAPVVAPVVTDPPLNSFDNYQFTGNFGFGKKELKKYKAK